MTELLDQPFVNISDMLAQHGRFKAKRLAVVCGDDSRTWGDFDRNISRVAHALIADGLQRGDRVAVLMDNAVEMLEVVFGVIRAGGCAVPLSGLLTGAQMAGLITDSRAARAFASAGFRERLDDVRDDLGQVTCWVGFGFTGAGWTTLEDFIAGQPDTVPGIRHRPGDDFNIIYSSGTTGLPKGIVQTHAARLHFAFSNAIELGITSDARTLTTTSLYSNGTWIVMLPTLFAGGTLHVMPAFDPAGFLDTVKAQQITHSFMVPAQFIMILDHPAMEAADTTSLQRVVCAGSPLRRDVKKKVLERLTPGLCELYGFSEGFAAVLKPGEPDDKFATVGIPVMGFDLRVIDEEGRECPPGKPGEIVGYGAGMLREYNGQPALTEALIWRDEHGRTFIRSGDVGVLDQDGYLTIIDRKKDMIISGGFNVFPTDVEAVVGQHPDVADVCVIGVPHDKWGETCLALVIPRGQADPEAVKAWSNERLAKYQRLHAVEIRQDFPRNALGKVLKRLLRDPYWADARI
ncbi:class I adenylate-forming enzyme family protein [Seohaeicola saemankumensis]|uniref:Class I adenylate-forming enzyme family protein n=1 Tax=Seohaeicola saemankumensis TaxID=481181 RepID=A0ABW3TC64_9RHOB